MFTGIIKGRGRIAKVLSHAGLSTVTVELEGHLLAELEVGASVSIDGVCLTATSIVGNNVVFDIVAETLRLTTLGALKLNDEVNVERSSKGNVEVGGHVVSGHIDTTAQIVKIEKPENNFVVQFKIDPTWTKYIFNKGFIAINGASLTLTNVNKVEGTFSVWLIPETLRITTFSKKSVGARVNIEIDRNTQVIVDTVIAFLETHGVEKLHSR